jgi:hypothetical protein
MLLFHPSHWCFLASIVAADLLQCDQRVAALARRRVYDRWKRSRPTGELWTELIIAEIEAIQRLEAITHGSA